MEGWAETQTHGLMAFLSFILTGGCTFDETLTVSGNGSFTFCYDDPFLYVTDQGASSDGILKIYDMSDPTGAVLLSTTALETGSGPQHPVVSGTRLYIPYKGTKKLAIWDVSNRASPSLLGSVSTAATETNGPTAVAVIGTTACVCFGYGNCATKDAAKIDCSNPASPSIVATFKHDATDHSNAYVGAYNDTFFISGSRGGSGIAFCLSILESTFAERDFIDAGILGEGLNKFKITSDGSYLYGVITGGADLWTLNVSDPTNITVASRVSMTQTGTTNASIQAIEILEDIDRLYVGRGNGSGLCIPIMNISTRSTPSTSGSISTNSETVTDMCRITSGCSSLAWGQGTGAAIRLMGTAPTS